MWWPDIEPLDNTEADNGQCQELKTEEAENQVLVSTLLATGGYKPYLSSTEFLSNPMGTMKQKEEEDEHEKERQRIALELRRKKQREVKRRSRAKQKDYVATMQEHVRILEVKLSHLTTVQAHLQRAEHVNSIAGNPSVIQKYTRACTETEELRTKIAHGKQRIAAYERFEELIHSSQETWASTNTIITTANATQPDSNQKVDRTFTPLSEEAYLHTMCNCYLEIFNNHPKGDHVNPSHPIVGWTEKQYSDGANFRYSFSKSYPGREAKPLMEQTWELSIGEENMKTLHPSTLGVKILQDISDDAVVLERTMNHHYYLDTVVRLNFLVFRFQIKNGWVIVYAKLENEENKDKTTEPDRSGSTEATAALEFENEPPRRSRVEEDMIKSWIDVVLWFRFEETLVDEMMECNVTYGGTLFNTDLQYANFFLVEIMTMLVRWDQAMGQPFFSFFESEDTSN